MHELISPNSVRGRVRLHEVDHSRLLIRPITRWKPNLVLYDWAAILTKLLTAGNSDYKIDGMYLEYENVASPGDTVAAPAYDRSGGRAYYDTLSGSGTKDYLRVPMTAAQITSSDEDDFPEGNVMTFFAQSQGVVGTHGKAFASANNSKIYGGALVALVDPDDATRDVVFSRFYFDAADQQVKLSTSQLGLEWEITLQ